MSIFSGTNTVNTGLIVNLDASSVRSNRGNRSIINWDNWIPGPGGVPGYSRNGQESENERIIDTNPWGRSAVVWEARPLAQTDDDGGWNTNWFNIDNTKRYRFSVWVRRTSTSAGGTFYLGMYANGDGSRRMDNSAVEGNAYWECTGTGALVQNQWYLWVGHVYPWDTTFTGRHPDTGYYTTAGRVGNVGGCNIGSGDLKWSQNSTQGIHRTYLYYCSDNTTRLQFYQPRVDLCDGTEPTIAELLANAGNSWNNLAGSNSVIAGDYVPQWTTLGGVQCFNFDKSGAYWQNNNFFSSLTPPDSTNLTIDVWYRPANSELTVGDRGNIVRAANPNGWYMSWNKSNQKQSNYWYGKTNEGYHESGAAMNRNQWYNLVAVWTNTELTQYLNTTATTAATTGSTADRTNGLQIGWEEAARQLAGGIAQIKIYNRALSAPEIFQNFNALKGRFGIL